MDFSVFPTTPAALATVVGAAVFCVVVVQILKNWITERRVYNIAGLGATFVAVEIAGLFLVDGPGLGERLFVGFLVALFGAALATEGYETITNLLGLIGVGNRSNAQPS